MSVLVEDREKRFLIYAISASLALHILVAIIFWLIHFDQPSELAEWVEVSFENAVTRPAAPPSVEQAVEPRQKEQPAQIQAEAQDLVDLPTRRMLEDEPAQLRTPRSGKLSPGQERPISPLPAEGQPVPARGELAPEDLGPAGDEDREQDYQAQSGLKQQQEPGEIEDTYYTIEGEAAERLVLRKVIPEYPPGIQREATVRIRFTVEADGRVGTAIPIQKGDADLEKVALQAFRQWRFNALPPSSPQQPATGIITFRFVLE